MNLSLAMPFWLNWLWKSDLKIRTGSYGYRSILPMLKIAIGESMEEENLLLNRNKKKKKGETCVECGVIFQMPKMEREAHSYSDKDSSRKSCSVFCLVGSTVDWTGSVGQLGALSPIS